MHVRPELLGKLVFDVVVDATHTGILKPDPRAYARCTRELGVEASDCVLVDDQQRNVEGARRAGWQAVQLDVAAPGAACAAALRLLGVDPPDFG